MLEYHGTTNCSSNGNREQRSYDGKVVLVTGASGVLGVELCHRAALLAGQVIALTRRPDLLRGKMQALGYGMAGIVMIPAELADAGHLAELIGLHKPNVLFHLASRAIVFDCERHPRAAWGDNCTGSFNVAEALRDSTVEAVVVSTSDKAYGSAARPYREDMPLAGGLDGSVYEMTKVVQEAVFTWLAASVSTVILRCCNIVGLDLHCSRIIPATVLRLLEGRAPRLWPESAGHVRTYVDARDAADAFLLAGLAAGQLGVRGEAFNVANPANELTSQQVVDEIMRLMNVQRPIEYADRPGVLSQGIEIPEQTLDITKIRKRLGWAPTCAFEETLKDTIQAYQNHLRLELPEGSESSATRALTTAGV